MRNILNVAQIKQEKQHKRKDLPKSTKKAQYLKVKKLPEADVWKNESIINFDLFDDFIGDICESEKYVLMIDEVDKSSNNSLFLKFLGVLRDKYLRSKNGEDCTFQSVILAGVYDIKNLKVKMVADGKHQLQDGEKRVNSPWNIAIDYGTEQFIIELKLWYGESSHTKAYEQLVNYLKSKNKDTGYLITFDFRKNDNTGAPQFNWVEHNGKKIFDVMVGV